MAQGVAAVPVEESKKNKHARKRAEKNAAKAAESGAVVAKAERRDAPGCGQGLFLTQPVEKGGVIVRAIPALHVVFDPFVAKVCSFCYKPTKPTDEVFVTLQRDAEGRFGVVLDGAKVTGFGPGSANATLLRVGDVLLGIEGREVKANAVALLQQAGPAPEVRVARSLLCAGCGVCNICPGCARHAQWHAHECASFAKLPASAKKGDTSVVRMLLRYRAIEAQGEWCSEADGKEPLASLATLQASNTSRLTASQVGELAKLVGVSAETCSQVIFQIRTNACEVARNGKAGCALSVHMGYTNHSCAPNATAQVDAEGRVAITADRDLAADEQVLISYVDKTLGLKARKQVLSEHYGFLCTCERCTSETERVMAACADAPDASSAQGPKARGVGKPAVR